MCGITGWVDFNRDINIEQATLNAMTDTLARRGPDAGGIWTDKHIGLGHRRLSVIDPQGGVQPMSAASDSAGPPSLAVMSYNGEVYNYHELREELIALGHTFNTLSDTEVILRAYLEWKADFVHKLNGIFAIAIWDQAEQQLLLVRDRLGVKPLYYYPLPAGVLFGSEPKAILANPLAKAQVSREGICDSLLFIRTPGRVPFQGMFELKPGHTLTISRDGIEQNCYWRLTAKPHTDDLDTTIKTVQQLLEDAVKRQTISNVPLCSLLSGGLDSSSVSALAQKAFQAKGDSVSTFVVDFVGQSDNYRADPVRPSADLPFAKEVAEYIHSDLQSIILDKSQLLDPTVRQAVMEAWDLPYNFGDLDISLYLLFSEVRKHATVALSGEAADELFGGYLWFTDQNAINANTFPWIQLAAHRGLQPGKLFNQDALDTLKLTEHQQSLYEEALAEVPVLAGESAEEQKIREISYLTLTRWLPILLEKKDRMSMAVGLEGRVPFCDHRLVEYVFNIPWKMKSDFPLEKGILREAVSDILPDSVIQRKKAAYPSVQDCGYDKALVSMLKSILGNPDSALFGWLSEDGVNDLICKTETENLSDLERILVDSTVRLDAWINAYKVELLLPESEPADVCC